MIINKKCSLLYFILKDFGINKRKLKKIIMILKIFENYKYRLILGKYRINLCIFG